MSDVCSAAGLAPALRALERGMALAKCRQCGCMASALQGAARAVAAAEAPEAHALAAVVADHQVRMEPPAYDCLGCRKCWAADAAALLPEQYVEDTPGACSAGCACDAASAPVVRIAGAAASPWPPYPGDYLLGAADGPVAVCTLASRELAPALIGEGEPCIAIAGRCETENIGVEKVVLNLLANPRIRWLVLCGVEARGHRAADAFLRLAEHGVDADMRVLESASWRPVLRNLTLLDVARFREQVQIIDMVGVTDPARIAAQAGSAAASPAAPLPDRGPAGPLSVERIRARPPERLRLDPAGFFIVLPQADGIILLEHYANDGRLLHVVEGRQATLIAATAVERGLVSRLDHAAYLGRELARAEAATALGTPYEQDAALGGPTSG